MRTADFAPFLFFGTKRWGIAPAFPFFFSFINEWIAGQKKIETKKTFALAGQMKIETKMTFAFARHLFFTDLR